MDDFQVMRGWLRAQSTLSRFSVTNFSEDPEWISWVEFFQDRGITAQEVYHSVKTLAGGINFPVPQEIHDHALSKRNPKTSAQQAFDELWRAIGKWGGYQTPSFSDEKIGIACKLLGGWNHICDTWTDDERQWRFKEFAAIWDDMVDREAKGLGLNSESPYPTLNAAPKEEDHTLRIVTAAMKEAAKTEPPPKREAGWLLKDALGKPEPDEVG